ncbi:MAG: immunoglobulin domain-containing protein [Dermatophilaceae bacterium]
MSGYSWAPATFLSNTTIQNPVATAVTATTTYTVTATSALGCTNTGTVTVTLNNGLPLFASSGLGGPATFCQGSSVTLNSTVLNGCPPYTYAWSDGVNTVATTPTYTATATGSYSLTVTDAASNFVTTTPIAVTATPLPTASASSNSPVCVGQPLNLIGTTNGTSFSWTGPNSFSSTSQNPSIASPTAAASGTYTFTATGSGCASVPATTVVVVKALPPVVITPATTQLCPGGSLVLTASSTNLTDVMASFNVNSASILATIPTPSGFTNGLTGTTIADGCNDMYNTGNRLNTNLATAITYSNNAVISNANLGADGRYFTLKIGSTCLRYRSYHVPVGRRHQRLDKLEHHGQPWYWRYGYTATVHLLGDGQRHHLLGVPEAHLRCHRPFGEPVVPDPNAEHGHPVHGCHYG